VKSLHKNCSSYSLGHVDQSRTSNGFFKFVEAPLQIYSCFSSRAGLKPMQLHWAPRLGVWVDYSFLPDTLALENSVETTYKFH